METNENGHAITPNLWDTAKAVLRGKLIAFQAYHKKVEKCQINNLTLHLEELEKQQAKPRVSRGKEIRSECKSMTQRQKKNIQKINESRSWVFKNKNKIDESLNTLVKKKR